VFKKYGRLLAGSTFSTQPAGSAPEAAEGAATATGAAAEAGTHGDAAMVAAGRSHTDWPVAVFKKYGRLLAGSTFSTQPAGSMLVRGFTGF
jgi:hypothetical protein